MTFLVINKEFISYHRRKVCQQNVRAKAAGMVHDLTTNEWLITLKYFGYKCAYCGQDGDMLDHVVSIRYGGGTTRANCVPVCSICNIKKAFTHWSKLPCVTEERKQRIVHFVEIYSLSGLRCYLRYALIRGIELTREMIFDYLAERPVNG